MPSVVDVLEERVVAAANLIASLRAQVQHLERELLASRAEAPSPSLPSTPPAQDPSLIEEIKRLRDERVAVRESVRELIREIDRVSW